MFPPLQALTVWRRSASSVIPRRGSKWPPAVSQSDAAGGASPSPTIMRGRGGNLPPEDTWAIPFYYQTILPLIAHNNPKKSRRR